MSFNTLIDLTKQAKINVGDTAVFQGSMSIQQKLFITNVQIDPSSAIADQTLTYDPLTNKFSPSTVILPSFNANRVLFGMQMINSVNGNALSFDISSGRYSISGTSYNFTGLTVTTSSGNSTYNRYDVFYVTGDSISNVNILQGTPAVNPIIPLEPSNSVIVGIAKITSGLTSGGTKPQVITINLIPASNVAYYRGSFSNVSDYLDSNYVYPQIYSFTSDKAINLKGTTVTGATFSWTTNKKIVNLTGGTVYQTGQTVTGLSVTSNTSYLLTFDDGIGFVSQFTPINFYNNRYWGNYSGTTFNTTGITNDISTLLNSEYALTNTFTKKSVSGNGQYIVFAQPVSIGSLPTFFVNGTLFNDFTVVTQNFTNSIGYIESYYICRTNYTQSGSNIYFEAI